MIGSFLKKNFKKLVSCMVLGTIGMSIFPVESVQALTRDSEKEKIINQYIKGVKMLPEQVEARKEKAKELGLEEYVDNNYFLTDKWYEGRSEADINRIGANILVDTVTNEELDAWANNLKDGISPRTVTKYEMVSAGGSTVGKYEVDGKMAFCAQHSATSPAKGAPTSNARLVTKDSVRKVLYYGYGGPKKLSDINGNAGWVTTTLGLSYAYTGSGGQKAKAFVDRVSKMATPPSGFKVYVVDTNGGRTQDLMYWNYSPKGTLQIEKSSADTSITNGNNCYSLEGAIYGVYKNSNATNKVAELKTNASGKSNIVTLDEATYYVKEIKAPKGYALDTKIYSIKVNAGKLSVGKYKDRPQSDPVNILLKKVDSENGTNKPQGNSSLANAEFTVKFYEGNYGENVNPETLGKKPTRTWVLKTDNDGYSELHEDYKVSGDKFYYMSNGDTCLPLGTVTMQETKAPKGYKINSEIFVRKITPTGSGELVHTYNAPVVKEEVIKGQVKIVKVDEETGAKLEGAKFEVKDKKTGKVLETLTTDKKGEAITKQYPFGTELVFREIKAPDKYVLNGKEYFATINDKQQTIEITVTNRIIKGSISIHKIDKDTKKGLEGVEFDILDSNDKVVEHLVTDKNGNLKTKDLVIGVYKFVETKGLDGYLIDSTPIVVNITENKEYSFTVENEKLTGSMELLKVDNDTKEPMKDVEFKVVGLDSFDKNKEFTLKTNEEGKAVLNGLHKGKFRLTEVKTLDGYVLNTEPMDFEITENGQVVKLEMTNKKLTGSMELLKVDNDTKEPMKDVEFKVVGLDSFDKNKEFTLKTNEEGKAIINGLHKGKFRLTEVKTLDGYVLNTEPIDFEITENGQVVKLEMTNKKLTGSMELLKLDNDTKEPMKDVEFKVVGLDSFDKDKEFTLKTNEEGKAVLTGLHKGKFRLEEIKTIEGYLLNENPIEFEILENNQVIKIEMTNQIKKGSVRLLKVDEDTNRKLENAVFELHKVTDEEDSILGEYTTDKDGEIFAENLIYGDYYFKEVQAPNHYELSEKTYPFSVREDREVIEITATNKVKMGEVEFSKTDLTTGENIDGAKIEITGIEEQNNHVKFEFTSSKDGNKFTLPEGKYEFKEIQAPNGYVISEEVGTFEIKNGEVVTKAELKNKRIEGTLDFTKVDVTTGKPLDGAQIKIECLEGFDKGKVIEFTSSKDGNKFKLFAGKYKISETQAPNGYETTTETGTFEITEEGQVIKCKLENKMKIKLPATGYKANKVLATVGLIISIAGEFLVIKRRKK